jgi:hypothetical protein
VLAAVVGEVAVVVVDHRNARAHESGDGEHRHSRWERVIPFLAFPDKIRRIIYSTSSVENLHMQVRKTIKTRGHFPNNDDAAALRLIWLAIIRTKTTWRTIVLARRRSGRQCAPGVPGWGAGRRKELRRCRARPGRSVKRLIAIGRAAPSASVT